MIIDEHKIIFVHIPKNAGTSIKAFFGSKEFHHKHKTIEQIKTENIEAYNSYRKFTVVRNPYDRIVSWYFYLKKEMEKEHIRGDWRWSSGEHLPSSFKEWVKDPMKDYYPKWKLSDIHNSLHTNLELNNNGREHGVPLLSPQNAWLDDTVEVLKYESLNEDINEFFGKKIDLPMRNKTDKDNYINYYDKKTLDVVYNRYEEDFNKYKYKKL